MPTVFEAKKTRILRDLNVPAEQYQDASPKGTVDEGIRDLVDKINELDSLVTTSSCAGRMALYLEGSKSQEEGHGSSAASASVGGKGGGDWLFVSHDPIPEIDNDLESFCSPYAVGEIPLTITSDGQRLLHFKFEPMILHILANSLENAERVLAAAQEAGFRESGIASISRDASGTVQTVMLAVRTTGLSFDTIVGCLASETTISPLVTPSYVPFMVSQANKHFRHNAARTKRFTEALMGRFRAAQVDSWEPADLRRARMREEGLKRARQAKLDKEEGREHPLI